jgi:hypothetical protein
MNRRKFFAGIAAAITAAVIPIDFPRSKGPGFIASMYSYNPTDNVWWRAKPVLFRDAHDYAQIEVRTLAALERAWKECVTNGQKPEDIRITDETLLDDTLLALETKNEIHRSGRS